MELNINGYKVNISAEKHGNEDYTGMFLNEVAIAFGEMAHRMQELGCPALAKSATQFAHDIDAALTDKGYYK